MSMSESGRNLPLVAEPKTKTWVAPMLRNRFAAAKTYAELCDASKEFKRTRDEWQQASEDAFDVNLERILPTLGAVAS